MPYDRTNAGWVTNEKRSNAPHMYSIFELFRLCSHYKLNGSIQCLQGSWNAEMRKSHTYMQKEEMNPFKEHNRDENAQFSRRFVYIYW